MINFKNITDILNNMLDRFVRRRGESNAKRIAREFASIFPGRCMICSLHQYGLREGLTRDAMPEPHDCIENRKHRTTKARR
jgi:hypothetical protein